MSIKTLVIAKRLNERKTEMTSLLKREADLKLREDSLRLTIEEANTEEELDTVNEEVEDIEKLKIELEEEKKSLQEKINEIEEELKALESDTEKEEPKEAQGERKNMEKLNIRNNVFNGYTRSEVESLVKRDDVQSFIQEVRSSVMEKRALSGGSHLIPETFLGLIRDVVARESKLVKHINLKRVAGTARAAVAGAIPEAVWTEMCANLNELTLSFSGVEVDGYKVGGFVAVCNAQLADSDVDLANEVIYSIAVAIARALDKAIVYGTGTKMPIGIIKALDGVVDKPNLVAVADGKGATFYENLLQAFGKAKSHGASKRFYAMNEATFNKLQIKALSINASGAIVSGQTGTMPIIGGTVEIVDSIADDTIVGGFGDFYLLAERQGVTLEKSTEVRFIQDQTVFKGTGRYDGKPVHTDAFVAVKIGAEAPTPSEVAFVGDTAND